MAMNTVSRETNLTFLAGLSAVASTTSAAARPRCLVANLGVVLTRTWYTVFLVQEICIWAVLGQCD